MTTVKCITDTWAPLKSLPPPPPPPKKCHQHKCRSFCYVDQFSPMARCVSLSFLVIHELLVPLDDALHHWRVCQCADIPQFFWLIGCNFAQNPPHDLSWSCPWQALGDLKLTTMLLANYINESEKQSPVRMWNQLLWRRIKQPELHGHSAHEGCWR